MKTDEELKQLAKDLYSDKIFTDRHIAPHDQSMIGMIFMPVMFMQSETKAGKNFIDSEPAMFYEYMDKASPRGINGYPMFMSMAYLTKPEVEKMNEYYLKIKEAMDGV